MRKSHFSILILLLLGALAFGPFAISTSTASARNPAAQPMTPFPTPTPRANGQVIYVIQQGDSLYRIAGIIGMDVEELAALNGMDINDGLRIGQEILLGQSGPALPTESVGGSPTPTEVPATATPVFGTGEICVLVYLDQNGNARIDEGELPLEGGQVSVVDLLGVVFGEHTTDDNLEGHCFEGIENGDYTVSAAVPPEYNSTTAMNIAITLNPGDIKHIEFGAQGSGLTGTSPVEDQKSSLLGIIGLILLGGAGLLGFYAWSMNRQRRRSRL